MKKFFNLLALGVAALGVFGLASCGGKDSSTKTEAPTVPQTEESVKPAETTKPAKPEIKPNEKAFMTNTQQTAFGPVICDVLLDDEANATFDVTTTAESMNKTFDKKATYTFADNVYTFTIEGKEYKTAYDKATKLYSLEYVIEGDMKITFKLVSKPTEAPVEVFMTNTQNTQFGPVTCDVILNDATNATFDVTTKADMMNEKFDKKATYTFANNIYTFTIDGTEYKTTYDKATKLYSLEYTIQGDMKISFKLVSKPTEAPAEIFMTNTQNTQFGPVTCDVILLDETNVKFDVTTKADMMNEKFDATGTYTVADGVYTFTIGDKTYTTTLTDGVSTMDYTIEGDMTITFKLTSAK